MRKTLLTDAMWAAYRGATGLQHDDYAVAAFGNGTGFETKLAELVLAGRKRATAGLLRRWAWCRRRCSAWWSSWWPRR